MSDVPSNASELMEAIKSYGLESLGVYYGNYRGVVVDNKDPEKLGRVKIRVHQIASDDVIESWAWPKGQIAGEDFGDFFIPPKGSPVWIEFENGDPQHPIWSGGHWAKENGKVPEEGRIEGAGNRVRKSQNWVIEMDDDGDKLKIKDKAGNNYIEISGGAVLVKSVQEINFETVSFNVEASGTGTLELGGATLAYSAAGLIISVGGVPLIEINGGGVSIQNKDFLTHQHTGVDPGPGNTGGVF